MFTPPKGDSIVDHCIDTSKSVLVDVPQPSMTPVLDGSNMWHNDRMDSTSNPAAELFWELAAEFQAADDRVVEGTIMGSPCLRVGTEFLAMPHHKKEGLVVKLPSERVAAAIETGEGESFAPAGKVFKEWLAVTEIDEERWRKLLAEGVEFVG